MALFPQFFRFFTVYSIVDSQDRVFPIKFHVGTGYAQPSIYITNQVGVILRNVQADALEQITPTSPEPGILKEMDSKWGFQTAKMYRAPLKIQGMFPETYVIRSHPQVLDMDAVVTFVSGLNSSWLVIKRGIEKSVRVVARQDVLDDPAKFVRNDVPGYLQKFVKSRLYVGPLPTETEPERLGCVRSVVAVACDGNSLSITHLPSLVQIAGAKETEEEESAKVVSVRNQGAYLKKVPSEQARLAVFKTELLTDRFFSYILGVEAMAVRSRMYYTPEEISDVASIQYHESIRRWNERRRPPTPSNKTPIEIFNDMFGG
jgi:hypothetical protein